MTSLTLVPPGPSQMSWRPQYRSSKFRNVYGKVANREHCFDGIPITKNVHDNHFCAVNARFLAIVTESAGGGSFLVIPLEQVGALHVPCQGCSPRAGRTSLLGLLPLFLPLPPSFTSSSCVSGCAFSTVFLRFTRTSAGRDTGDPRSVSRTPQKCAFGQVPSLGGHVVP